MFKQACLGDPILNGTSDQLTILYEDFFYAFPLGVCKMGHMGVLCSKCTEGYAKIGGDKCSICKGGLNIFLMILKILLRVLIFYYTIYKALMMCCNVKNNKLPTNLIYSNFLLKIIMLHLQFLKSFSGFPFNYPGIFKEVFSVFTFSISSGVDKALNLECFFDFSFFPIMYLYTIINIISPLIVTTSLSFFVKESGEKTIVDEGESSLYFSNSSFSKKTNMKNSHAFRVGKLSSLPYFFIIALMLTYGETLGMLMNNFSAINIDDDDHPEYRLVNSFEIEFYSNQHKKWVFFFAIPFTILLGVLIPFYILYKIFQAKKAKRLQSKENLFQFGYFFFAYDDQATFYESTYFFRRLFLVIMDTFFIKVLSISDNYDPLTFLIVICFFYTLLSFITYVKRPYKHRLYPKLNYIENLSISTQALTSWVGSFLLSFNKENTSYTSDVINMIGFIFGCLINVFILFLWGYFYWKLSFSERFNSVIRNIKQKINNRKLIKMASKTPLQRKSKFNKINLNPMNPNEYLENESADINEEIKSEILFHPVTSRKMLSRKNDVSQAENNSEIYRIRDHHCDPRIGEPRMSFLWDHFNFRSNDYKNGYKAIRFNKNKIHLEISDFSKKLKRGAENSCQIDIEVYFDFSNYFSDEIECYTISKHNGGSKFIRL